MITGTDVVIGVGILFCAKLIVNGLAILFTEYYAGRYANTVVEHIFIIFIVFTLCLAEIQRKTENESMTPGACALHAAMAIFAAARLVHGSVDVIVFVAK